jgi:hypothetical protein
MGCCPVAVVIMHVHKYWGWEGSKKFKSGGLHEKRAVATWNIGNHLCILI